MQLKSEVTRAVHIVKIVYTPLSFLFILYFTWLNRAVLARVFAVADLRLIIASVCLWCLLHLLSPLSPKIVFACLGTPISYSKLLMVHISRLPARYLPGGIWHTVGRLTAYHSFGIVKDKLALLILIEIFFPCLITFFVGGGYLWLAEERGGLTSLAGLLAMVSCCTMLVIPFVVKWQMVAIWRKKFLFYYLSLIVLSIFFWIIASSSFVLYYSSISLNIAQKSLLHVAATYIFSWGIGYVAIFAPQGLGVFEVVASKLMTLPMTLGGAVAFLAGFRIVGLAADCIIWIFYYFLNSFSAVNGNSKNVSLDDR